jgi:hypothetical protein
MGARRCAMGALDWRSKLTGEQVRPEDVTGKTVAGTYYDGIRLGLRFADGTYLYVEAEAGCDEPGLAADADPRLGEAFELGILAPEDYHAAEAEYKRLDDARARAEYERLKARFEGE